MKLKALVRWKTGHTIHSEGAIVDGQPVPVTNLPPAHLVELVEEDGNYFLYRQTELGGPAGDTWHESIQAAKSQAKAEYGIQESDWKPAILIWDYDAIAKGPSITGIVQGVPDSARRADESHLDWSLRMLLKHLQALAADLDTILEAYPPRASPIDELLMDFSRYLEYSGDVLGKGLVSDDYLDKARLVDEKIDKLSKRHNPKDWTDEAIRTRPEWIEIRYLAKKALAAMGYDLEPPPRGSM